jgi:hypothetical protein
MYPVTHLVVHNQNADSAPVLPPALTTRGRARRAGADGVAIRAAGPADGPALAELAEIDGDPRAAARFEQLTGDGVVLVADLQGRPAAALDVERDTAVADPFEPTAALVDLLRVRARQLRGGRGRRAWRLRVLRPRFH